jgi:hypothetical protein
LWEATPEESWLNERSKYAWIRSDSERIARNEFRDVVTRRELDGERP